MKKTYVIEDFFDEDGNFLKKKFYNVKGLHRYDPLFEEVNSCEGSTWEEKARNYYNDTPNGESNFEKDLPKDKIKRALAGEDVVLERKTERNGQKVLSESRIITTKDLNSDEEILRAHGYEPKNWDIVKYSKSEWDSNCGEGQIKTLHASKIVVRPKDSNLLSETNIRAFIDQCVGYEPSDIKFNATKGKPGKRLLVIPIADLHYGLLAKKETSKTEYNMDIAEKRLNEFIETVMKRTDDVHVERILLTLGNDFFNADTLDGTTCHGTHQDQEDLYFPIVQRGFRLVVDLIDKLGILGIPLTVASVQANHDRITSHMLMIALNAFYRNTSEVEVLVDSDMSSRFYYRYGSNLFGFGHDIKPATAAAVFPQEAQKDWSATKFRTFFIAHLHHEEVDDFGTCVVRRLPILSGSSNWAYEKGFINSGNKAQAFIYGYDTGLEGIINVEVSDYF